MICLTRSTASTPSLLICSSIRRSRFCTLDVLSLLGLLGERSKSRKPYPDGHLCSCYDGGRSRKIEA